ncbi:MAG: flavodoxin domain-containing protein [Anaerolineae bacterium]
MSDKILVAYASKYGATAEIAEKIGATLKQTGLNVELRPAEQVTDVTSYAAVVLGSAVYAGMWRKEAVEFLETLEPQLADRVVWFFSSGPTGEGDPIETMKGWRFPEAQQSIASRLRPRDIAFFHGYINLKKLNLAEKMIVKGIKAPTGDYRDWSAITAWATHIAEALRVAA